MTYLNECIIFLREIWHATKHLFGFCLLRKEKKNESCRCLVRTVQFLFVKFLFVKVL